MTTNHDNIVRLRVLLGFLKAGRVLDHASSVLLLGTLVAGFRSEGSSVAALLGGAMLLGLLEKYLAWRVALDVAFFAILLEQPSQEAAFDAALADFLGRPAVATTRPMTSRWQGARRLVLLQAVALGAQVLAVGAGMVYAAL